MRCPSDIPKIDGIENFNIYDLDTKTGKYKVVRDGRLDQLDFNYKYKDIELVKLLKDWDCEVTSKMI